MQTDRFTPLRALLPGACASLAVLQACAQIVSDGPDGGAVVFPDVSEVAPAPGAVAADARFRVSFTAAMDLSLLLVEPSRSETVGLAPQADADLVFSAMNHGKLTVAQRALLVAAAAISTADARTIELQPAAPLKAGAYALLISARLKDTQGRKLNGNGVRYDFTVDASTATGPLPQLETPARGGSAPSNLRRVRVSFPRGAPNGPLSIVAKGGSTLVGPLTADGGPLTLALPDGGAGDCHPLCGATEYALAVGGQEVPGESFTAASCQKLAAPRIAPGSIEVRAGDTWAEASLGLDGPALVTVRAQGRPMAADAGCDPAPAVELQVLVRCTVDPCGASDGGLASCPAVARLEGLKPGASYLLHVEAEDDEGLRATPAEAAFDTVGTLPAAVISEVMASPPLPAPRSDGEYIEILNTGASTLDLARLAIGSGDDHPRPLVGTSGLGPTRLGPGERALAVGADFDQRRYALPSSLVVVRAETKKLLGRGLADQPPGLRLFVLPAGEAGGDAGPPLEIDHTQAAGPHCAAGLSLERASAPDGGWLDLGCGADGGTPGRPPPDPRTDP